MIEDSDEQDIALAAAGNEPAFCRILDRNGPRVLSYVRRMMGQSPDVEDIFQDTFLRFWSTIDQFDPAKASLPAWLHRIAHNLCIDAFRRQRPREDVDRLEDRSHGPAEHYVLSERSKAVHHALERLPERQRSAIVLCHYQHFSNRDAAEVLEISVDALESLLRRGRKNLKQQLAEKMK